MANRTKRDPVLDRLIGRRTLPDAGAKYAETLRQTERGYAAFSSDFHLSLMAADTADGWTSEYADAWDALKATAGTKAERAALKADIPASDADPRWKTLFERWNRANAADKTMGKLKVYRSTVTKVVARIRDNVGADAATVWSDIPAETWTAVRDHFRAFPNMARALVWAEHGGDPADPVKPAETRQRTATTPDADADGGDPNAADILAAVLAAYDQTAHDAVAKVLASAWERVQRDGDADA